MYPDSEADWRPPTGTSVLLLPAGRWWDAVKAPHRVGEFALKLLAYDTGGVIEDSYGGHLYWLVRTGSAADWRLPHVTVLSTACYVAVPPAHRTEGFGVRWLVPCEPGHALTDAADLWEALDAALGALGDAGPP